MAALTLNKSGFFSESDLEHIPSYDFACDDEWKFVRMITDGIDKTPYSGNDRFWLKRNGKAGLISDGLRFEGYWNTGFNDSIINVLLIAKYSCEQSGMGYSANYKMHFNGTVVMPERKELVIKGNCAAVIEEWYYGTLPTLPSTTEIIYPFEWGLYRF